MSEQPAASVNAGFSAGGMPIGLQLDRPTPRRPRRAATGPRLGAVARPAAPVATLELTQRRATFAAMTAQDARGLPVGSRSAQRARGGRCGAVANDVVLRHAAGRPRRGHRRRPGLGAAAHHEGGLPGQPDRSRAVARSPRAPGAAAALSGAHPRPAKGRTSKPCSACVEGRWSGACRIWDALLIDHPRDALALQWAQLWDFYRGDAAALRARPARALPEWDEHDPLYPHVLALWAFGLEENHCHAQAEEAGRRALALDPRAPWAVHAVAHVMEMQGRFEDGAAWLRQHQPAWAEGNGFAGHLWWHTALFRLEALDIAGALRLIDGHLAAEHMQITLQRVDAASVLWRLHLLGADVAARAAALQAGWPLNTGQGEGAGDAGHYAFNDVHAVLPMLLAGDLAAAERWVARCAERALAADDARRNNHAVAREVGLPLMRGLLAFARGEVDDSADLLYTARSAGPAPGRQPCPARPDRPDAARGLRARPAPPLGRALLNERVLAKPVDAADAALDRDLGRAQGAATQMTAEDKRAQRLQLLDDHIGRALQESQRSGELQTAASYGKPLDFGDGYEQTPQELRMGMKVLKDAGFVPHEVTMMREAAALQAQIEACSDDALRPALQRQLALLRQSIALRLERLRGSALP